MAMETSSLKQKALLWAANGVDNYGDVKVDAAIEIDVRWEDRREETVDANGKTIAVDATVYVDRVIPVLSIMWLGTLRTVADPPVNLNQVLVSGSIPDVKGRHYRRWVKLMRYSNELPALA